MSKTACFTGHRPTKLGGYYGEKAEKIQEEVYAALLNTIEELHAQGFDHFISGGAVGVDQLAMTAVLELRERGLKIKLTVARPFPSQDVKWPDHIRVAYQKLLEHADNVVNVSEDPYTVEKMHIRNHWMVDESLAVIAVYNGGYGGTKECIDYARTQGRAIKTINPYNLVERWENAANMV